MYRSCTSFTINTLAYILSLCRGEGTLVGPILGDE